MAYQSVNPFSGEKSQSFAELSDAALEERLARAHECYRTDWRRRSIAERSSSRTDASPASGIAVPQAQP